MTDDPRRRVSDDAGARPAAGGRRGYWIDPPPAGRVPAPDAEPGPWGPEGSEPIRPAAERRRVHRRRTSRRRRLVRLGILLVVLAGVATAVALIVTGRTVVPVVSENLFPIHYQAEIADVAERYGLDPYLVAAVAKTESGFDPAAVSPVGAVGLMQLMPATADWITTLDSWQGGGSPDLTDAADSLELGACYLAYLAGRFGEDNSTAVLAAYNAGPTTVGEWAEAAGGVGELEISDIAFPETRSFVGRVERYRFLFSRIHPDVFTESDLPARYARAGAQGMRA